MRTLLLFLMLFSWFKPNAQTNSRAYKVMLEGMYKHTVPTISCSELKKEQNEVVLLESSLKWNDTLPISERNRNTESLDRIREEVEHIYDFMKGRLNQL